MGIVIPTTSSAKLSLIPRIPFTPRSESAKLMDLFGSAALFAGILGSIGQLALSRQWSAHPLEAHTNSLFQSALQSTVLLRRLLVLHRR
jgi:hypothetical protein